MREIKYRWMKNHSNEWVYWNIITDSNWDNYIIPFEYIELDWHHIKINNDDPVFLVEWTVWEYTWLKDKNWEQVYEWDILEWKSKEWNSELFIIEWDNKNAKFIDKCICHWYIDDMNTSDMEIIWNIYENKKLFNQN